MDRRRVDVKDAETARAFDVPGAGAALVPLGAHAVPIPQRHAGAIASQHVIERDRGGPAAGASEAAAAPFATKPRSWVATALRIVRNAAVAVAVMALVPIGFVALRGDSLARALYLDSPNMSSRVAATQALRKYALAPDATITPTLAGASFNALHRPRVKAVGFENISPAPRPAPAWRTILPAPDVFPAVQQKGFSGPVVSNDVLEATARGLSIGEMGYLRAIATDPVWRDFDLVARAAAIDIIGTAFRTPFGGNARPEQRPLTPMRDSKELATAAVWRAAYHLAMGQRDSAEAVLRAVISFGFTFIDNGSAPMEELIGTVIVGIGRDALQRFYAIEHDPRANAPELQAQRPPLRAGDAFPPPPTGEQSRAALLQRIDDAAEPLAGRLEGLRAASGLACTNERELLLGSRSDVTDLLKRARRTVARFPSERALIDLNARQPWRPADYRWTDPAGSLAVSMASVAGTVFNNPRLAQCTAMLMQYR
jgi:hypothetical protein